MSKKRIITISRSFGSGGRMIGEELARRLEYHFYDRNLLDLLSEKTGISEQGLESADEKLPQKILALYNDAVHSCRYSRVWKLHYTYAL